VFLTGGAVRDIVSGASIRDLDITVQTNPLRFKKDLAKAGFTITGEHERSQTLYLRYADQVRAEISAARIETFPKPGRPEYHPAGILSDLGRRDFTANAMALSLNEGSWGLLLDPLNGSADISARQLRLASNYGFLDDPIRLVRAARLVSRTGWEMEERTKERYESAKSEGVISAIQASQRGYELEEIAYEEDPLQVMKALESEGWMQHLSPAWNSRSADAQGIERLHQRLVQLLMAGLHPDPAPAQFRLLTAKLSPANLSGLKRLFVRNDLVERAADLDRGAKKVLQLMTSKEAAKPSRLWHLLHGANHDAVLWLFFTGKSSAIQNRFEKFFTQWPEARQKIPNALLQTMRIVPGVPGYDELLDKLTFAFMDGELPNDEAVQKLAEPYSPPAPAPVFVVRRGRTGKRAAESKGSKAKAKKGAPKTQVEAAPEAAAASTAKTEMAASAAQTGKPSERKPSDKTGKPAAQPAGSAGKKPAKAAGVAAKVGKASPSVKSSRAAGTAEAKPAPKAGKASAKSGSAGKASKPKAGTRPQSTAKAAVKSASKAAPKHSAHKAGSTGSAKAGKTAPRQKANSSKPAAHAKSRPQQKPNGKPAKATAKAKATPKKKSRK
jgi:tRNA nucleotidyltransferase/poly(A) polymerase